MGVAAVATLAPQAEVEEEEEGMAGPAEAAATGATGTAPVMLHLEALRTVCCGVHRSIYAVVCIILTTWRLHPILLLCSVHQTSHAEKNTTNLTLY